jgi:hypothetical protein
LSMKGRSATGDGGGDACELFPPSGWQDYLLY